MLCKVQLMITVIIIERQLPFPTPLPRGQEFEGKLKMWKEVWCSQEIQVRYGYQAGPSIRIFSRDGVWGLKSRLLPLTSDMP